MPPATSPPTGSRRPPSAAATPWGRPCLLRSPRLQRQTLSRISADPPGRCASKKTSGRESGGRLDLGGSIARPPKLGVLEAVLRAWRSELGSGQNPAPLYAWLRLGIRASTRILVRAWSKLAESGEDGRESIHMGPELHPSWQLSLNIAPKFSSLGQHRPSVEPAGAWTSLREREQGENTSDISTNLCTSPSRCPQIRAK